MKTLRNATAALSATFKIVAVVVASALGLDATASIEFASGGAMIRLSDAGGAVESLLDADGTERVTSSVEAFTLQLLDGKGEPTRLKSREFVFSRDGCLLEWRHANGLRVSMEIEAVDGEFRFRPSVEGIPAGMLLEWFDGIAVLSTGSIGMMRLESVRTKKRSLATPSTVTETRWRWMTLMSLSGGAAKGSANGGVTIWISERLVTCRCLPRLCRSPLIFVMRPDIVVSASMRA